MKFSKASPIFNYRKWDFLIFTVLTLLSVLNGQTTLFYLVYFFWWNELIRIAVDRICYKQNPNSILRNGVQGSVLGSLSQMAIYFVFIVVFFGLMANWKNTEIMIANIQVLFFQNWFFNLNLIYVLIERVYLHQQHLPVQVSFGHFTPNMIVLHIAIILGGILMFFVVKNFPATFTPDNLWGSVIIISPLLVLKMVVSYFFTSRET